MDANMTELIVALLTAVVSVAVAGASLIASRLNAKKIKENYEDITKMLDNGDGVYYVICPHCGKKVYLTGVTVYSEPKQTTGGTK